MDKQVGFTIRLLFSFFGTEPEKQFHKFIDCFFCLSILSVSIENYKLISLERKLHSTWHFARQVEKSPFVERLLKAGYEVLYLVEAVDEYAISSLPEYDGKKFQNVAKETFTFEECEFILWFAFYWFNELTKYQSIGN